MKLLATKPFRPPDLVQSKRYSSLPNFRIALFDFFVNFTEARATTIIDTAIFRGAHSTNIPAKIGEIFIVL